VLYGDVALDGALKLIKSEAKSKSLDCLAWKIRRVSSYERDCR